MMVLSYDRLILYNMSDALVFLWDEGGLEFI
jgi:hypothetical protein